MLNKAHELSNLLSKDERYILLGQGRNRIVYRKRSSNYVIKIPISEYGAADNCHERRLFIQRNESNTKIRYARCRLLGIILVMQYARCVGELSESDGFIPYKNCPKWADYIDCAQIGYNRFGQIVAYDYGRF